MNDIKHRLLEAAYQSPGWSDICTAAHDHIAAQEKRIVELESQIAAQAGQEPDAWRCEHQHDVKQSLTTYDPEWARRFGIDSDFVVTPLYAAPPAPSYVIDAERYRFMRKLENDKNPQQYDDVIDAAMKAAK